MARQLREENIVWGIAATKVRKADGLSGGLRKGIYRSWWLSGELPKLIKTKFLFTRMKDWFCTWSWHQPNIEISMREMENANENLYRFQQQNFVEACRRKAGVLTKSDAPGVFWKACRPSHPTIPTERVVSLDYKQDWTSKEILPDLRSDT
jgi:hypothetical protein